MAAFGAAVFGGGCCCFGGGAGFGGGCFATTGACFGGANVRGGCFSSFFGGGFAASSGVSRSHMTDASVYCGSPAFLW